MSHVPSTTDLDLVVKGLSASFQALAELQGQPAQAAALREFVQMTFDLNTISPLAVPQVLDSVGLHAGGPARELAVVCDAFRLAGREMMRISGQSGLVEDQSRALQLFACAQLALPMRNDGTTHALYSHAYPLQHELLAAQADVRKPLQHVANALATLTLQRMDPRQGPVRHASVPIQQLLGLSWTAQLYAAAVHREALTPW